MRGVLRTRVLTVWATIRMEAVILVLMTAMVTLVGWVAVGQLRRMGRGSSAREGTVAGHGGWHEVVTSASASCTATLARMWGWNVGHLMRLVVVCVLHHLLISPLGGELRISWIVIRVLEVHLSLCRMTMKLIGLLVGILVERGVILLGLVRVWCCPSCLLLLDRVRIGLLCNRR